MPSMFGGDQCSKDYAPHMWIGDSFIADTGEEIRVGTWCYYAGRTENEILVAERWLFKSDEFWPRKTELVPDNEIPQEVREAINKSAFAEKQNEIADIEADLDATDLEGLDAELEQIDRDLSL